jgi:hypothetical protein
MSDYKDLFDQVITELKMYRTLDHGSYSYPFMHTMTYNTQTGKRTVGFTNIQVTGWKFIYKILNCRYEVRNNKICLLGLRKKPRTVIDYPLTVRNYYMKSHLDYLMQLSLPPLPIDYDKFSAYYGEDNHYKKWFPLQGGLKEQFYRNSNIMAEKDKKKYFEEIMWIMSGKINIKKRRYRLCDLVLNQIHNYLI